MVQNQLLDTLSTRMTEHAQLFDGLLHLIPAKFYITEKNDALNESKFMHNKRKKAPKQAIKESTKKAKKAKLDPENDQSITTLQKEKAEKLEKEKEEQEAVADTDNDESDDEVDDNESDGAEDVSVADESDAKMEGADFSGLGDASSSTKPIPSEPAVVKPMNISGIGELRNRLHERIQALRKKRHAPGSDSMKARSREDIIAARLKRKQDRKKALKAQKEKGGKAASEELVKDKSAKSQENKSAADSIKMDGDVFFSKLAVANEKPKKKGPSDAKSQLKKAEAMQEKLEKLKSEDKTKAEDLAQKSEWQKAIAMATGVKVKDDVKLLKKTVKRQEKIKVKSAKEWSDRKQKVKDDEQRKIKKRQDNIQARIDAKKAKKTGKKVKARPGFEGGKNTKGGKISKPKHKKK
ncbi:surfeit locus protein 6-domain-containing protein [Radiomyces spectabilis]|uniref:surfeit locus protein 6-domain-containing protein n=1 Tax=Radiomyces spectabilis TaxID=64574 RepID=UPI002220BE96|nr:surfeit locus protein 6-domain-containing protein [Radiomyces spectabilis]KAI8366685.1 surfeit locus protein 6-domain-containing protein [Radiomyces spectabilis]